MIRRRIRVSVAVKWGSFLSPWRGRQPHARRHARPPGAPFFGQKKRAVKLGEPHRPFNLPTEGGVFHRKVTRGERAFDPPPGKSRRRGRLKPATPSISLFTIRIGLTLPDHAPGARYSAFRKRDRDKARRPTALDTHQNAVLVVTARGIDRFAHVTHIGDALSGDFQNNVTFLEPALGRRA